MERVRSKRTTNEQRVKLLQYLKTHPDLMKGGQLSPAERTDTWNELAKILNSVDGPKKSADRWLKSFHDWKSDVRCKKRALQTNEGAPPLTKNEKELLRLMNELQDGQDDDDDDDSDDPLLPKPFPSLDIESLKPEPRRFSDSEPDFLDEPEPPPRRHLKRKSARNHSDDNEKEEPDRSPPRRHSKRKSARDHCADTEKEAREERAIRAMEGQAASLDRMASAMERIAEALTNAIHATIGGGKDL